MGHAQVNKFRDDKSLHAHRLVSRPQFTGGRHTYIMDTREKQALECTAVDGGDAHTS